MQMPNKVIPTILQGMDEDGRPTATVVTNGGQIGLTVFSHKRLRWSIQHLAQAGALTYRQQQQLLGIVGDLKWLPKEANSLAEIRYETLKGCNNFFCFGCSGTHKGYVLISTDGDPLIEIVSMEHGYKVIEDCYEEGYLHTKAEKVRLLNELNLTNLPYQSPSSPLDSLFGDISGKSDEPFNPFNQGSQDGNGSHYGRVNGNGNGSHYGRVNGNGNGSHHTFSDVLKELFHDQAGGQKGKVVVVTLGGLNSPFDQH